MTYKKVIIIISCLLVIGVCATLYFTMRFVPIPDNAKIRDIEIDRYSVKYFLTDDNGLYIGGTHGDSYGLYDTGFRWGFLYGTRRFFCNTDAPVLFAENVKRVFEATNGFLYTNCDDTLFYFGSGSGGRCVKVADHVKYATGYNNDIIYIDSIGEIYHAALQENICVQTEIIGVNAKEVYSNGFVIRVLDSFGSLYQAKMSGTNLGTSIFEDSTQPESKVQKIENNFDCSYILKSNGELLCYHWPSGFEASQANDNDRYLQLAANAVLADMNYDSICYLTNEGIIEKAVWLREKEIVDSCSITQMNRTDIIDIAVDYTSIYILFSDGTYIQQEYEQD